MSGNSSFNQNVFDDDNKDNFTHPYELWIYNSYLYTSSQDSNDIVSWPLSCDTDTDNTCGKKLNKVISVKQPRGFVVIDDGLFVSSSDDNTVHM